jgi:hypothetical protein
MQKGRNEYQGLSHLNFSISMFASNVFILEKEPPKCKKKSNSRTGGIAEGNLELRI